MREFYRIVPHFYIVCNGIFKQSDFLIHNGKRTRKHVAIHFGERFSVVKNFPVPRLIQPRHEFGYRRFSATRRAYEGNPFPRFYGKRKILYDRFGKPRIAERYVFQFDIPFQFGKMIFFSLRLVALVVAIDLYARKVIAYKISRHNSTQLTKSTVKAAYGTRKLTESLLFHSDQGSNYTSSEFRKYLKSLNIGQSFSNPGMPYDNSVMESFFGSFKREALYRYRFKTEKDFFEGVATYINFYNNDRPHSVLMNQTPDNCESKYFNNNHKKTNFETEQ